MLSRSSITLLVGGSIAAYKSAELTRELVKRGAKVRVAMSEAACEFITPLTLQTLSGHQVCVDPFEPVQEHQISHLELANEADLILAAPATANLIAKAAAGIADDLPSSILLGTKGPVLVAPAMNNNMWENPVTQRNVSVLKEFGVRFVGPDCGELACGWYGAGRLSSIENIVDNAEYMVTRNDLGGCRVIVTAGPTREAIDPVRFVSNRSTGKMGFAIARAAKCRGAEVKLISGPTRLQPPEGVDFLSVTSAEEMRDVVMKNVMASDSSISSEEGLGPQYVFMVAAVTDHRPAQVSEVKLKHDKTKGYSLRLEPSPDILQGIGEKREEIERESGRTLKLIGFTAETGDEEELIGWARDKLEKKNADLMVGNFAEDSFEKDTNRVWLLDRGGRQDEVSTADKHLIAGRIVRRALRI